MRYAVANTSYWPILLGLINLPLLGGGAGGVGLRALQQGKPTPSPSQEGNRNF
jgi:hypothetical protein